jgi:membrane-bound lytic murein transglycosylase D
MSITRPIICKILTFSSCIAVLAACAPVKTGDINREYQAPIIDSVEQNTDFNWGPNSYYPPELSSADEEGRLFGDVEPEPEQTKDQELQDLELLGDWDQGVPAVIPSDDVVENDFPVTLNKQVQYYLDFFMGKQRDSFAVWLSRSGRFLPIIQEQLGEAGLPGDLAYLAMIESGYNERAYSRARAVGIWQFIKSTGRNYGLEINTYIDERRDPVKSTQAAVSYLSDLYSEFGSWYLAVAAYNAGEGKIRKAIKKYNTTDFWEIAQGKYLKLETKRYVPKLIAAILIAKEPEKYGFTNIEYEPPLVYETVNVPRWTAFKAVALAGNIAPDTLKRYNNELRKEYSPPDKASYPFKVPAGKKDQVEKNLPRVQAVVSTGFKTHTVKKGETLDRICRKYGLTKTVVLKSNNLGSTGLKAGQRLRIPYQITSYEMLPEGSVAKGYLAAEEAGGNFVLHKVRPGETISHLTRLYSVPVHLIAAWNDIDDISRIRAGQQLVFYVKNSENRVAALSSGNKKAHTLTPGRQKDVLKNDSQPEQVQVKPASMQEALPGDDSGQYYLVREGDSLWSIARRFDLDSRELQQLNSLTTNVIHPGDHILLSRSQPAGAEFYYDVRKGDSLWTIAKTYKVSADQIKRWNNLTGNMIHPGKQLLLKVADAEEPMVETFYQVRNGDSLWTIARMHNISTDEIKRWNKLKNNTIYPGNRLLIKIASGG